MITPDTKMCTSESVYLKPAPLKPYQDNLYARKPLQPANMVPARKNADEALKIKSRGLKC